jgi:hypothetical protein
MTIEGDNHSSKVALGGKPAQRGNDLTVTAMDAIERADSDSRTLPSDICFVVVVDDVHD